MKLLFIQSDPFYRLGLMALAGFIHEREGHDSRVLVYRGRPGELDLLKSWKPDVVGFYVTAADAGWTLQTAAQVKKIRPIPVIAGGPHPTFFPEFASCEPIDAVCQGEGEGALLDFLRSTGEGSDLADIPNLVTKASLKADVIDRVRPLIDPLDELPFPRWQIYADYPASRRYYQYVYPVVVGRGCPGACSFCCMNRLRELYDGHGKFIRLRSPEHVIEELSRLKRNFPVRKLMFEDDTFVLNRTWMRRFAELYTKTIRLPFSCQAMAPLITSEMADLLQSMGCIAVRIGLETGNEEMRWRVLNKRVRNSHLERAAGLLQERRIAVQTYNMFGVPGETLETALETYDLNRRIGTRFAWSSQLRPFPGTDLHDRVANKNDAFYWHEGGGVKNYFQSAELFRMDPAIENVQKFQQLFLSLSLSSRQVRKIVQWSWLRWFHPLFALSYALSVKKINRIPLLPFLRMGLSARSYMKKRTEKGMPRSLVTNPAG